MRAYAYGRVDIPSVESWTLPEGETYEIAFPKDAEILSDIRGQHVVMGRFVLDSTMNNWKSTYDRYDRKSILVQEAKKRILSITQGKFRGLFPDVRLNEASRRDLRQLLEKRWQGFFVEDLKSEDLLFSFRLLQGRLDLEDEHPYLKFQEDQIKLEIGRVFVSPKSLRRDRTLNIGAIGSIAASWINGNKLPDSENQKDGMVYISVSKKLADSIIKQHGPTKGAFPLLSHDGERDPGEVTIPGWEVAYTAEELTKAFEVWAARTTLSQSKYDWYKSRTSDSILKISVKDLLTRFLPDD